MTTHDSQAGRPPMDAASVELMEQVRPSTWTNPRPAERYNMVVIGGGTGGLVTAAAVAGLGGKAALIEENLLGGDCLNAGCVPSKALLRAARAAADVRCAEAFGVRGVDDVHVDFAAVMDRVRAIRAQISHHDSAERLTNELGVDVFLGRGRFTARDTVQVGDAELKFSRACIATGARPDVPPIPGLAKTPFLTNENVFELTELPPRLGVIGAGPIGVEMAQAFCRLGSQVTVFDERDRILAREDADAANVVRAALEREGVTFRLGAAIESIATADEPGEGQIPAVCVRQSGRDGCDFDRLLVATGRVPNVEGLGLDAAGVAFHERTGVQVNAHLRTTNRAIYAVGDVATTRFRFTHAADAMARVVVRNALFFGRQSFGGLVIPRCTYTEPALAHVGWNATELAARRVPHRTFEQRFCDLDRAIIDGEIDGFARIHVTKRGKILGATIVGPHAGDMISEVAVAIRAGMKLGALGEVIHPYPTMAEAVRRTGDDYTRGRITPVVQRFLRWFLALRR